MWVIIYKLKGQLNMEQRIVGPFSDYGKCEDFFGTMGAASMYDHKYIEQMVSPDNGLFQLSLDQGECAKRALEDGDV